MKVLSLFDGVSGAMLALKALGLEIDEYYASEINEKAISVSRRNWPEIVQVGDITNLMDDDPRFKDVDLLIAGSPCTNLSIAGDGTGLEGEQSKLFYEFIRLLKAIRPKHFLLENVASMTKDNRNLMTEVVVSAAKECLGEDRKITHFLINSANYSAQARKRLYWTTCSGHKQVSEILRKRTVADIMEDNVDERFFLTTTQSITPSGRYVEGNWGDGTCPHKIFNIGTGRQGERIYSKFGKSVTVTAGGGGPGGKTGLYLVDGYGETDPDTIMKRTRRLTPVEAERLQGVPDNYTKYGHDGSEMAMADRYEMMGNGFTIPVIYWLLRDLREEYGK